MYGDLAQFYHGKIGGEAVRMWMGEVATWACNLAQGIVEGTQASPFPTCI